MMPTLTPEQLAEEGTLDLTAAVDFSSLKKTMLEQLIHDGVLDAVKVTKGSRARWLISKRSLKDYLAKRFAEREQKRSA